MPPQIRFTKGDLLRAAFTITRSRGIDAVNARSLARELGCSTQPIFRAFNSMSDVKQAMLRMAMETYSSYIARSATLAPKPYLGSGMAYILFAREERELFTLLFMRDRMNDDDREQVTDTTLDHVIELTMKSTGLCRERALEFHRHLWIFTHGLASMVATRYITLTDADAMSLLQEEYQALRLRFGLAPAPAV